jgi:CRISPR-associated Csx2 family protein
LVSCGAVPESRTHFITFLGRGRKNAAGDALVDYAPMRYRFPDGAVSEPHALFARAALDRLDTGPWRPDRLVILGTAGSMWDTMLSDLAPEANATDLWAQVREEVFAGAVTQARADEVGRTAAAALGRDVTCRVLPTGLDERDQLAVLSAKAEAVAHGDRLLLDVTHGYRHLPLFGLVAASLLAYDRECEFLDIWYAAFQMADGTPPVAPVIPLRSLLHAQEWGRAFALLRESGRYAPLAALLGDHPAAKDLRDTGFFLATNQVTQARRSGRAALEALRRGPHPDPLIEIVRDDLIASLTWVEEERIWDRMLAVARRALESGDHLEAVTLTLESLYWAAAWAFFGAEKPAHSYDLDRLKRRISSELRGHRGEVARFHTLRKVRNAAAHGLRPHGRLAAEVGHIMGDPDAYRREVGGWITWVETVADRWAAARRRR